ncbi:MAG: serine/threonine protein kinase [Polyangiaceae bacterium]|nr:serine/threonine protein kinase [Polyangiaceae bacterium]
MFVCPECGESLAGPGFCARDRTPLVDGATDLLLGQSIGPYRVACRIGAGSMGQVYKGVHPAIGSRVAIKVLSGDWGRQQSMVERFFSEARAVNVIRHEGIVNVLDLAWLPDGRPYIVMEYLDGQPLSGVIRKRGALPLGALVMLVAEVLDALTAAHAQGIIHRDLKPDNIYVTQGGRAKVLDFGIAKLRPELASGSDMTATGSILGTPQYMSPEQALGRTVDARSDLYSVGVILFEGAAGRLPFVGSSLFDVLKQQIEAAPPSVKSFRPDTPPLFDEIVQRVLEKDPARRFGSAAELSAALAAVAQVLPRESFPSLGTRSGGGQSSPQPAVGATPSGAGASGSYATDATSSTGASCYTSATTGVGSSYYTAGGATFSDQRRRGVPGLVWLALALGILVVVGGLVAVVLVVGAFGVKWMAQQSESSTGEQPAGHGATSDDDDGDPLANPLARPGPVEWTWQKPKGFDPKRLDAGAHLKQGEAFAKKSMPDAELIMFAVYGVNREGLVDLSLTESSSSAIVGRWRSLKLSERPAGLPVGAKVKAKCTYAYIVGELGILAMLQDHMGCDDATIPAPKCTIGQILAKAEAQGAPRTNYIADVSYVGYGAGGARWWVKIGDGFQRQIEDACP